jgi:hypothetical protein
LRLGLVLMFILSFEDPWREIMRDNWRSAGIIQSYGVKS